MDNVIILYELIRDNLRKCRKHTINGDYQMKDELSYELYNTLVTAENVISTLIALRETINEMKEDDNNGT